MTVRVLHSIHDISAGEWNALDLCGQPFLHHEFLAALEDTGCACQNTGWSPHHLVVVDDAQTLSAAMPLYLKSHSFGEFVFDFSWAEAYAQAGLNYYPKLVSAIPFTPANGPRIIRANSADNGSDKQLLTALTELTSNNDLSSAHVLYADETTQQSLNEDANWLPRTSCDFHWFNRDYQSMDHFFEHFRADKRKKARRERRRVEEQGISFRTLHGNQMTRELCNVVFSFSEHTFNEHGHEHYLNADFFYRIAQSLSKSMMVKLAEFQGEAVAAAVFFRSDDTLFGRYWGSAANFHSLHFETCYYQGIEYCIEHGLKKFEPGTQGEHKVPRGFEPALTHSYHFIRDQRFRSALRQYLQRERDAVGRYAAEMKEHVPFHRQHIDANVSTPDET